jgi:hypothetical protein
MSVAYMTSGFNRISQYWKSENSVFHNVVHRIFSNSLCSLLHLSSVHKISLMADDIHDKSPSMALSKVDFIIGQYGWKSEQLDNF